MRPIRRILVAVKNPQGRGLPAVVKGGQVARALGAEVILFHAIAAPLYLEGDISLLGNGLADAQQSVRNACRERLEGVAKKLRRKGLAVSVAAERDNPVHEAVLRAAARHRANPVVAELHPGRHMAAGILHLTDWELLRLAPMPVLLVKRSASYRHPVVLAAVDPDHSYAKPAWLDAAILGTAGAVAAALHGALHAVHAYVPVPLLVVSRGNTSPGELERVQAQTAAAAKEKLARLSGGAVPAARRHVVGRHAADAIEQVAAETHSAIVVMGAIARSGLKRLLIGNTAERVLDHLPCDLLIVKPAGFKARIQRKPRVPRYGLHHPAASIY